MAGPHLDFDPYLVADRGRRPGVFCDARDALRAIPDGGRVFVAASCSTPFALVEAMADERAHWQSLELVAGHLRGPLAIFQHMGAPFRFTTLQASGVLNPIMGSEHFDILPCRYSDFGRLFGAAGDYPVDAALVQVSPPGPDGRVSLGLSVGSTLDLVRGAPLVIAQVNPQMPYTYGAGELETTAFDFLVEHEAPVVEVAAAAPGDDARAIAKHAAAEIRNGSTLQFGIGAIPDAILQALSHHRDLGIHGGMVSDACRELFERGALSGAKKSFGPGVMVAAEVIGTRSFYDWVHQNPLVQMAPSACSHGAVALAGAEDFVAINSAVEIAFDGTVNAETIGERVVSGPGGQPDFAIGGSLAASHRSILAFPSTAARGKVSRIVPRLSSEVATTLPRYLVDRIITEYGVARLRGLPLRKRRDALIAVAHPDFRDSLQGAPH